MTLTTHAAVGSAIVILGAKVSEVALPLAFLSHFALDAIPHWDYKILSLEALSETQGVVRMKGGPLFYFDLLRIGADAALGLLIALVLTIMYTAAPFLLVIAGALAGMLPDFLQFAYGRWGGRILGFIQTCHNYSHTSHKLVGRSNIGILSQGTLLIAVMAVLYFLA